MILFVTYGGGHIAMIDRIKNYLASQGLVTKILPLTTAIPYLNKRNSLDFLKLEDLCVDEELSLCDQEPYKTIIDQSHNDYFEIPKSHTKAYHVLGLKELIEKQKNEKKAIDQFKKYGRFSFLPLKFAFRVLSNLNPRALFVTNLPRFEDAFVQAANELSIPTFGIDDLLGSNTFVPKVKHLFVENSIARNNYIKKGFKERIIISGNPVFEEISKLLKNTNEEPDTLLILLQPNYNKNNYSLRNLNAKFYSSLWSNLSKIGLWNSFKKITVRFHPSMQIAEEYLYDNMKIDVNLNLHDSISKHSHVLGFNSTSLYECVLAGKSYLALTIGSDFTELPIDYQGNITENGEILAINKVFLAKNQNRYYNSLNIIFNYLYDEVFCN